jgi:hypothetical protein
MVRRKKIRKRMRTKLREIKQQLRQRMYDPVRQTGHWLKSIVEGHFNYYAVPATSIRRKSWRNWWPSCRKAGIKIRW